jgi:hypothetical protein
MKIRLIVRNEYCVDSAYSLRKLSDPIVEYGPRIARIAGGFTATQATGGWIDNGDCLIVEPVTVFDCFIADDASYSSDKGKGALLQLAGDIAKELHQTCVYLEVDGEVTLVTPN